MSETIGMLRRDHKNMAKLLDALEHQIAVFDRREVPDYDVIRGVLEYCLSYPEVCHHPKEDLVLDRLRLKAPDQADRVGDLRADHEELAALTSRFLAQVHQVMQGAEIPREWFGNNARDFIDSYRAHMTMEEQIFLPLAQDTLSDEDWAEIDATVTNRDDPLFGVRVEQGFRDLRGQILKWDVSDRSA